MKNALVIVPARMQATRLPGKPMADIHGEPMIVHVWRRAVQSGAGRVVVATDSDQIVQAIAKVGGEAVMTRPDHASGSDRVFETLQKVDSQGKVEIVINLQGDLPTLDPWLVEACAAPLAQPGADIASIAAEITDETEWKAIEPLVSKVNEARFAAMAGGFGRGGRGGRGGDQAGGGTPPGMPANPEREALKKAIDAKASAAELKTALTKYHEARKAKQAELEKAQASLRKVLTPRQEAIAALNGLL